MKSKNLNTAFNLYSDILKENPKSNVSIIMRMPEEEFEVTLFPIIASHTINITESLENLNKNTPKVNFTLNDYSNYAKLLSTNYYKHKKHNDFLSIDNHQLYKVYNRLTWDDKKTPEDIYQNTIYVFTWYNDIAQTYHLYHFINHFTNSKVDFMKAVGTVDFQLLKDIDSLVFNALSNIGKNSILHSELIQRINKSCLILPDESAEYMRARFELAYTIMTSIQNNYNNMIDFKELNETENDSDNEEDYE